ncbi:penicillin acylase family protein [Pseudomaricurvus alkylphenolicus]|nr:penicillin acylase family protein [Pseudomaricurvus alkylphenolicus]
MTVWMRRFLILIPQAALLIAVVFYFAFKASLPALDGEMPVGQNLSAAASISRDALGIATIDADNRLDAAFALGFAHGQDRFFQMDIQRRYAAGEMSALLGDKTLKRDKSMRLNQFRQRALQTLSLLTADSLQLLEHYVAGVNRGLSSLGNSPWEYLLLGQEPQRWRPEDSLLVSAFMFSRMTARIPQNEYARELLLRSGGEELLSFLQPPGTQWDTAIDGTTMAANAIPAAEVWSLSDTSSLAEELAATTSAGLPPMIGSNSWAVSRLMSEHGGGILANDPHLGFNLPHIWYRAQINYRDQNRQAVQLNGVSFPGLPSIAIGTNGKVAWGMTNSAGDWADLIAVEIKDDQYKTADGWKPLISHVEIIEVAGEEPIEWVVQRTEWGPVVEFNGEKLAHRWLAHFPQALDAFALL